MSDNERILFVDDDPPVLTAFRRSLRMLGFTEVDLADGAAAALALAGQHQYAVIATDYRMPEVDGLALINQLQALQPIASYILLSGQCDLELAMAAVNDHGVAHVLTKPWDTETLGSLLRRAIESHWEKRSQVSFQRQIVQTSCSLAEQKRRLEVAIARSEEMTAEALLQALDLRGHETKAHCRRVAAYASALAEHLGVTGHNQVSLRLGGLLHDVGKIGVPDAVLSSTSRLTEAEWQLMRQHPELGAKILDGFENLRIARQVVLEHHESWDGSGYPAGLAGEQISLEARLVAVADTFEALMTDRPYRQAVSLEVALDVIVSSGGARFDPEIARLVVGLDHAIWTDIQRRFPDEPGVDLGGCRTAA